MKVSALPQPRGPLSDALLRYWSGGPVPQVVLAPRVDALVDDDLHLALWACYQLHYGGFALADAHPELEWDLPTLAFRQQLEGAFEAALRAEHHPASMPDDPRCALRVVADWAGPPLSSFVATEGTVEHLREFAVHRSAYQLKEADPHTWGIPRLAGRGRSAMIEIQADEYGLGVRGQAHAELFADAMVELGLDATFGHYVDRLPGVTLATDNLVSMFGLNGRLRGALVGHLALFEMCSVVPMSRYLGAARRIGGLAALERFYEVHVEVDAHHGRIALDEMVGGVVADEPDLAPDVIFGAAALQRVEARFARHVLRSWEQEVSSLCPPPQRQPGATPSPMVTLPAPTPGVDARVAVPA